MSVMDRLKQMAAERKTREALRATGGDATSTRARLLETEDPKPTLPPSGRMKRAATVATEPPDSDLYYDGRGETVSVDVDEVKALTERAALCLVGGDEMWIPLSQMYEPGVTFDRRGQSGTIFIPEWLAEEKGVG